MEYSYSKDGIQLTNGTIIPWDEIENQLLENKLSDKLLISFEFSYGRSNYYKEQYLISKEEWKDLKPRMLDETIFFGEIAGKHSDVSYDVISESITEIADIDEIKRFKQIYGNQNTNADPIGTFLDQEDLE